MYETEHAPEKRVHEGEDGEKLPVPLLDHVTVPVGVLTIPVTVAVHVVGEPTATGDGEQLTEVVAMPIWASAEGGARASCKTSTPRRMNAAIPSRRRTPPVIRDWTNTGAAT